MNPQLPCWLAAMHAINITPQKFLQCLSHFSSIEELFSSSKAVLSQMGLTQVQIQALLHPNHDLIKQDLVWAEAQHHHLVAFNDAMYPPLLKEISDPPLVLYVQGNVKLLQQLQLAMVGSRHPTYTGLKNAEEFAFYLAQAGFTITSGMALGVDGAAHKGALAAGGHTIAVTGTGLQHIYPRTHKKLAADILANEGVIMSEFPLATLPHAMNFPRRNRIISGMSVGVLVVEAALKSGSLITANLALNAGREVFAIPGSIHHALARGCHHLIREGAKLVETAADILEELQGYQHLLCPLAIKEEKISVPANLPEENRQIFAQIGYEITSIDAIMLRSGLTASQVSSILLTLELNGYIESVPGGYVKCIANKQGGL